MLADANRLENGADAPTERSHASYSLEARGKETSFIVITALFVTLYVVSNVMAVKVIGLWNLFYFDAGTITFPFAYMLGDLYVQAHGAGHIMLVYSMPFNSYITLLKCYDGRTPWNPTPKIRFGRTGSGDQLLDYVSLPTEYSNTMYVDMIGYRTLKLNGYYSQGTIIEKSSLCELGTSCFLSRII